MEQINYREENFWRRKGRAFLDGIYTGIDFSGAIVGYLTKNPVFLGYRADKYSNREGKLMKLDEPMALAYQREGTQFASKERSIDEQIIKAFGDVVGLGANVSLSFIPQAAAMALDLKDLVYNSFRHNYYKRLRISNPQSEILLFGKKVA